MDTTLFTPEYSHITGLLQQLNDEELKELLDSEEKLKTIVSDLKQVQNIEAEREMLIASNKSISEYNLSKEPVLELQRKQVEETRTIAVELKDSFLEKKKKIESCEKAVSKETLLALLQAATSEVDEEAEASVEFFLKSELSVDDFLPKYLELRKTAHLRRIKSEKLANLLQVAHSQNLAPPNAPPRLRKPPSPPAVKPEIPFSNPGVPTQSIGGYGPVRTAPQPPPNPSTPYYPYPMNVYPAQRPGQPYGYNSNPYPGYMRNPGYPQYR